MLEIFLTAGAAGALGAAVSWVVSRRRGRGPVPDDAAASRPPVAPARRRSRQRLDELVDALPAAVLVVAPAGRRLLAANSQAREWLGRRQQPIESLRLDDVVVPEEGASAETLYGRLLHPKSASDRFVTFRHAEGHEQEAEVLCSRMLFDNLPASILLLRDISEVERARRVADAASTAKTEFLEQFSYQIRTPLNGIIGLTELALDADLDGDLRERLEIVMRCAKDLLVNVDDVLDVARIEAGRLKLNAARFDVRGLVAEVVRHMISRARIKGIVLIDVPRRDLPRQVVGDQARLRQVLLHLVGNAIKFTQSGEVEIRVAPVGQEQDGRHVLRFSVRDTGAGMDEQRTQRILDLFRGGSRALWPAGGQSGLGLAFAQQIATAMNGYLDVESVPGEGSTFSLDVPLGEVDGGQGSPPQPNTALAGRRVLLVHPSPAVRSCLQENLLALGVPSRCFPDLVSAIPEADDARAAGESFQALLSHVGLLNGEAEAATWLPALRDRLGEGVPEIGLQVGLPGESAGQEDLPALVLPIELDSLERALNALWQLEVDEGASAAAGGGSEPGALETEPILVVEDNPVNARLIITLLEQAGYGVISAENGREALEALGRRRFALVLMDIQMPEMDGLEATRRLRSDPRTQSLPVIAVTAHALIGDRERCLSAGMNDYLTKPVDREKLLSTVSRYVKAPGGGSASRAGAAVRAARRAASDAADPEPAHAAADDGDPT